MSEDEVNKLLLKQLGDGKVHGLGTRAILSAVSIHGFILSYSSTKGQGTQVKVLCPYVDVPVL